MNNVIALICKRLAGDETTRSTYNYKYINYMQPGLSTIDVILSVLSPDIRTCRIDDVGFMY